jgi:hypothetical protein
MIRITITPAAFAAIAAGWRSERLLLSRSARRMAVCISGSILASWRSSRRCVAHAKAIATSSCSWQKATGRGEAPDKQTRRLSKEETP